MIASVISLALVFDVSMAATVLAATLPIPFSENHLVISSMAAPTGAGYAGAMSGSAKHSYLFHCPPTGSYWPRLCKSIFERDRDSKLD